MERTCQPGPRRASVSPPRPCLHVDTSTTCRVSPALRSLYTAAWELAAARVRCGAPLLHRHWLAGPRIRSGCRRSGRPRRLVRCADLNVPATGCFGRLRLGFATNNQRCPHVYMSTRSVSTYRHPDRLPRGVRPSGGRSWRRLHTRSALPPARSRRRHTDVSACRHVGPAEIPRGESGGSDRRGHAGDGL